jgi:hypothetical protein
VLHEKQAALHAEARDFALAGLGESVAAWSYFACRHPLVFSVIAGWRTLRLLSSDHDGNKLIVFSFANFGVF